MATAPFDVDAAWAQYEIEEIRKGREIRRLAPKIKRIAGPNLEELLIEAAVEYWKNPEDEAAKARLFSAADAYENSPARDLIITDHAAIQYQKRSGMKRLEKARKRLKQLMSTAKEVKLKEKYRALQLINHDLKSARYYRSGLWIFVVCDRVLVTVHDGKARRWV